MLFRSRPADRYRLKNKGRIELGADGDVLVFDPGRVHVTATPTPAPGTVTPTDAPSATPTATPVPGEVTPTDAPTVNPTETIAPTPTPTPVIMVAKKSAKATVLVGTQYRIDLNGATARSFKSSRKKVATVDRNGVVTPKAKGKARITIKIGKKTRTLTQIGRAHV